MIFLMDFGFLGNLIFLKNLSNTIENFKIHQIEKIHPKTIKFIETHPKLISNSQNLLKKFL